MMDNKILEMRQLILKLNIDSLSEEQTKILNRILLLANEIAMELEGTDALSKSMQAYTEFYTQLSKQMHLNRQRFEKSAQELLNLSHRRRFQQKAEYQENQLEESIG